MNRTMQMKKINLFTVLVNTEDERLISKLNAYLHGYQEQLGVEFWDSRESEVNMYNVKEKLIENIEAIPEDYVDNLQYLHRLYKLTEYYLIKELAKNREEEETFEK